MSNKYDHAIRTISSLDESGIDEREMIDQMGGRGYGLVSVVKVPFDGFSSYTRYYFRREVNDVQQASA